MLTVFMFLFLLLSISAIVALVVGLIKPERVIRWGATRTRRRVLLITVPTILVSFIFASYFASKSITPEEKLAMDKKREEQQIAKEQEKKKKAEEKKIQQENEKKEKEENERKQKEAKEKKAQEEAEVKVKKEAEEQQKQAELEKKKQEQQEKKAQEEAEAKVKKEAEEQQKLAQIEKEKEQPKTPATPNGTTADVNVGSYSKDAIKTTLNRLNDNINSWKTMNGGKLNTHDVVAINSDLKFVLEHVQDLESDIGSNSQIEQFKRAINAHINAFEQGSVNNISKLLIQANAL
ncbi:hypothetical protein BW897_21325 [Bacillus cereus]|uniref:Uncharacterized protein n=1 Tax=Bacillus cereus TaxID=1396 RepID=A0A1S9TL03_BACCE|nr:hypothetical protein [Bacillus cereus]KZD38288.1 hypothetical protein B4083_2501 [Bacillus cereus]OOR10725.1 hypothetical protein BW897_21325 [Bacillus cereus]